MRLKDHHKLSTRSGSPLSDSRIKKASYYVWFLGAEECRGLRGSEVVRPVLQYLLEQEREVEPEKVTLQVSGRGIKLLQPGVTNRAAAGGSTKHFIPSGALTHVQQEQSPDDDIVAAVLLIYNPITRCPVHVHAYRCDSTETATVLRQHLNQLLVRPEQQAKLAALETRLVSRGLLPTSGSRSSDGGSSGSSISSGAGSGSGRTASAEKIANLYDSLAAELREKLGTRSVPLLLPPKDYERTGRRRKSKMGPSDLRRAPSMSRKSPEEDSARSSGIGSDDAPSPTHQEPEFGSALDHQSSSEEEWTGQGTPDIRGDEAPFLDQPPWKPPLNHVAAPLTSKERNRRFHSPSRRPLSPQKNDPTVGVVGRTPSSKKERKQKERSFSPSGHRDRFQDAREKFLSLERQRSAVDVSSPVPLHPDGLGRSTSWEVTPKSGYPGHGHRSKEKRRAFGSREDIIKSKSDKDNVFRTKEPKLKEKRSHRDSRHADPWKRDGQSTPEGWRNPPDVWNYYEVERAKSPERRRQRAPGKDHRMPRIRSPDRQDYHRAKSMHDLSQRTPEVDDERRSRDPRRRSLYDPTDETFQDSRRHFSSHAQLDHTPSPGNSKCSSPSPDNRYELPDNQRYPGLDRATARPDHLDIRSSKRTFDYPVNGGHAPIQITRAHHDDYRRFHYDHVLGPYLRSPVSPDGHY